MAAEAYFQKANEILKGYENLSRKNDCVEYLQQHKTHFKKSIAFSRDVLKMTLCAGISPILEEHTQATLANAGYNKGAAAKDGVTRDEDNHCYVVTFTVGEEKIQKQFQSFADAECWQKCMGSLRTSKFFLKGLALMRKAASDQKATQDAYEQVSNGLLGFDEPAIAASLDPKGVQTYSARSSSPKEPRSLVCPSPTSQFTPAALNSSSSTGLRKSSMVVYLPAMGKTTSIGSTTLCLGRTLLLRRRHLQQLARTRMPTSR